MLIAKKTISYGRQDRKNSVCWALILFIGFISVFGQNDNVRIKDVAMIDGLQDVQLFGYGLVVGLGNTGDRTQAIFTKQTVRNMLKNVGVELPDQHMRIRNVAAVMVTGNLKPFKKSGTRFGVTVSSMGDATSLEGGTLILTPLQGPDGKIYASAQGPLATGGFDIRNRGLTRIKKNHVLVGRVPDGAVVQNEYRLTSLEKNDISLSLYVPDFTSAVSMTRAINGFFKESFEYENAAKATDASTVSLNYRGIIRDPVRGGMSMMEFISAIENIRFDIDVPARIVINERTGTIVAGKNVRISEVGVTQGGIKVEITNVPEVVQPQPFTLGQAEVIPNPRLHIDEKHADMVVLRGTTTVADLAQSLNSVGVPPRDVIAILQAMKQAGALQAKLIIM